MVAAFLCGCSGINASHSISPLDFLLPGAQNTPRAPLIPDAANSVSLLAQADPSPGWSAK
jgi:hypothetical protein